MASVFNFERLRVSMLFSCQKIQNHFLTLKKNTGFLLSAATFGVLALSSVVSPVKAETFYVENQTSRFSVYFPDLWSVENNQKPDDKLTMVAPGKFDFAGCRVRVREERKHVIFPRRFDDEIQRLYYSEAFWDDYFGQYNDAKVDFFKDDAGLGIGNASMVEASFETDGAVVVRKKGMMFASQYHDKLYIVDCSAEESVYTKWRPYFLEIMRSVALGKVEQENTNGHYRVFQNDIPVDVEGPKVFDRQSL